jgi:predicted CoA-substrate-specific enzyme activase
MKLGIDLGSRFVKIAVKTDDGMQFFREDTVFFYKNMVKRENGETFIDLSKYGADSSADITATGYGRNMMSFANAFVISEIKAHYKGALETTGESEFILVDIGGQDSKVIYVKDGYIEDFVMNDKCAASTGRFLENACRILDVTLDELTMMKDNPVKLSSTCAVFSESELIGKIAEGVSIESIGAGVNESISRRLFPLIRKYRNKKILAAGGVASNSALIYFLSQMSGADIRVVENPQYNGCYGCTFY